MTILKTAKKILGDNLTAIEYFDNVCNEVVNKNLKHENPLGYKHNFYVVTEVSNFDSKDNDSSATESKLFELFEAVEKEIQDGVVAQGKT